MIMLFLNLRSTDEYATYDVYFKAHAAPTIVDYDLLFVVSSFIFLFLPQEVFVQEQV